jgi:hypothetical protein
MYTFLTCSYSIGIGKTFFLNTCHINDIGFADDIGKFTVFEIPDVPFARNILYSSGICSSGGAMKLKIGFSNSDIAMSSE